MDVLNFAELYTDGHWENDTDGIVLKQWTHFHITKIDGAVIRFHKDDNDAPKKIALRQGSLFLDLD